MNGTAARFVRFSAGLLGLVTLGWILTGQAKPGEQEMPYHEGIPTDWSHSHVIFSRPASDEQAREFAEEPRYWQQLYRRGLSRELSPDVSDAVSEQVAEAERTARSGGLWSEDMGAGAFGGGAANYPAKFGFSLTTANCASAAKPDYVVYSTGLLGAGNQASVVAYDNIYSGCAAPVPRVYWAYNTGGLILTSPVISLDGTQVAFAQTSGSPTGQAGLVILKWKASTTETVASPGVPTIATSAAQYRSCSAPCMWEVFLHDGHGVAVDDRTSSPFYDYTNDIAWVGGATGWLHKITGVFNGTPTEVSTLGFPVQVNPGNPTSLSNPVYDRISKNVFMGDAGGYFYRVASATGGSAVATAQLDFGAGLVEGPLLDQGNGFLYVFASSDGTTNCTVGANAYACSAIYLLTTTFASGSSGSKVTVGQSVVKGTLPNPNPLYLGGLDSGYYNSVGGTGNLYVCGNTGAAPILYRVPINSGVFGTVTAIAGLSPAGRTPSCSPVTDFPNPNANVSKTELLFFSVQDFGLQCGRKGCLINLVDMPWQSKTAYAFGQEILVFSSVSNKLYINTAVVAGKSGASAPAWPATVGVKTVDGTVTWLNQEAVGLTVLPGWTAGHHYGLQASIFDGTNVEDAIVAGNSGALAPSWNPTIGGTTTDNHVTWINAGPFPSASATVTGGTGGIIIDGASTSAGASQVYFFTLGNQVCITSGGTAGGCAMQASQSSLN